MTTLQDLAKETHNGDMIAVANNLVEENEILQDIHWEEANDITSHVFSFTVSVGMGGWRLLNRGVDESEGKEAQGRAFMGMHENPVEIDSRIMEVAPDGEKLWTNKINNRLEGTAQFLARNIFYGNHNAEPAAFHGIAPQMDDLSLPYVYGNGGSTVGQNTSLYGIEWGSGKVYMVHPRGTKVPFKLTNRIETYLIDENGKKYRGFRCEVLFNCGLVVEDPRCIFRIANIRPGVDAGTAGAFNENLLIRALNKARNGGRKMKLYTNEDLHTDIEIRAKDISNVSYTSKELFGNDVPAFKNRPIRLVERITNSEDVVLAS